MTKSGNILALEFSTEHAGLAAYRGMTCLAEEPVEAGARRCMDLFPAAERLLVAAGWTFADVAVFAVGRGPGSYTGLRVSLTAARGWAIPGGKSIWMCSSGAAGAAAYFAENPAVDEVVVWGDARRERFWAARFVRAADVLVRQMTPWALYTREELTAEAGGAPCLGPEWIPRAGWIARLCAAGFPAEEEAPLYLNPAVWKADAR